MDHDDEDLNIMKDRIDVYPNLMEEEIIKKFPLTVLFTSEYDFLRRSTEELAEKLFKAGRLADFCVHPGTTHCWYIMQSHETAGMFWEDQKKMFQKWLF